VKWRVCYEIVNARRIGVISENVLSFTDGRVATYETAILPLKRDDDPTGSFISVEAHEGIDHAQIPDLTPVRSGH